MSEITPVSVTVLQKEYKIACPPEQQEALVESAALVDKKMREIRGQGKSIGQDRVAIMAAINIAYELLQSQGNQNGGIEEMTIEVNRLREQVEDALFQGRQLELG
ncbi:MAG: cell division protein ZapA [Gammaproteobacteria bacterium]|jgi:cell division protein ZapA|nr:cell division protein ZapA [Gammaproteobacteria bacterium]MBT4606139.1 cell division protein ZapA [Thiotrichales bacterium]MBT3472011.1 cell division protein ZapA [Gammaproteobacteria bacterium]MBT3968513.1 cell division protein ZapA [Gammaproteobacteria bacterium]MBT4079583.1 cell division protein ZapA [Gammaproteobacteria bacterium]